MPLYGMDVALSRVGHYKPCPPEAAGLAPGHRVYDDFMVARLTGSDGLLRKIVYPDALKIAKETPVDGNRRYLCCRPLCSTRRC
ncbi:MAG: hypothetical protein HY323_03720 [Betaproteobacteria bacterium]|nr:hypothetical protein [Betaproteobacteria bacterium]